jgi:hypothetical protein
MLIYTAIWLAVTIGVGIFGFLLGKLPILDASPLPWVMHRSYLPLSPPAEPPEGLSLGPGGPVPVQDQRAGRGARVVADRPGVGG